jgi:hypothetical protein
MTVAKSVGRYWRMKQMLNMEVVKYSRALFETARRIEGDAVGETDMTRMTKKPAFTAQACR